MCIEQRSTYTQTAALRSPSWPHSHGARSRLAPFLDTDAHKLVRYAVGAPGRTDQISGTGNPEACSWSGLQAGEVLEKKDGASCAGAAKPLQTQPRAASEAGAREPTGAAHGCSMQLSGQGHGPPRRWHRSLRSVGSPAGATESSYGCHASPPGPRLTAACSHRTAGTLTSEVEALVPEECRKPGRGDRMQLPLPREP